MSVYFDEFFETLISYSTYTEFDYSWALSRYKAKSLQFDVIFCGFFCRFILTIFLLLLGTLQFRTLHNIKMHALHYTHYTKNGGKLRWNESTYQNSKVAKKLIDSGIKTEINYFETQSKKIVHFQVKDFKFQSFGDYFKTS